MTDIKITDDMFILPDRTTYPFNGLKIFVESPEQAEQLKKQIISEHEIVERLRNRITNLSRFPWMGDITTGIKNSDLTKILNEILGEK